ncbi:hypothetical protein GCM10020358_80780 [Amorphoplanes nipponensis]|uniref:Uncharacterized protein n=1 Tax=Actinoplanes nipponensis TaxID=135950 RepID=A0A919MQ15_9ACTN|nr:hypothetical protein [Actinoplanes nipponensis]GIE52642.1 hypothetical protein Ani05nite_61760 [Actinoplanes nipponensis]
MVIATVLLSIIGMSAGLVLGSRHEAPQRTGEQTSYVPTEPTVSPVRCPPEMHDTARRVLGHAVELRQVLRVRVEQTGTSVWICADEGGSLYYQANRGGEEKKWIEGETALFLDGVVERDGGYFAKAHDGNTFFVTESRLEVVRKGQMTPYDVAPE